MPRRGRISGLELAQEGSIDSTCSNGTGGESTVARQLARRKTGSVICLVAIISFIFAAGVVLLVILTKLSEKPRPIVYSGNTSHCVDVAVIGGGLAGCYTAWRLRQRDLSVHIYEMSNRIGGRLFTRTFPKIPEVKLELGGAYYVPARHRRMAALVRSLGLRVKSVNDQTIPRELLYYIRDMFVTQRDLNITDGLYHLDVTEQQMLPRDLLRSILQGRTTSLSEESLRDALVDGASPEAFRFLEATLPSTLFHADGSAQMVLSAVTSPGWSGDTTEASDRETLVAGMDALPRTLVDEALSHSDKIHLKVGLRLTKMTRSDGVYNLEFTETATDKVHSEATCAQRVVLALPPEAVRRVDWQPLEAVAWVKANLHSVASVPAVKVFLAYPRTGPAAGTTTGRADTTTVSGTTRDAGEQDTVQDDTTQSDTTDYETTEVDASGDFTTDENGTIGDVELTTFTPTEEGNDTEAYGSTTTTTIAHTTTVADTTITTTATTTTVGDTTIPVNTTASSVNTTVANTAENSDNATTTAYSNVTYDVTDNGTDVNNTSLTTVLSNTTVASTGESNNGSDVNNATTHDCITPASTAAPTKAPSVRVRVRTDMPMRYVEDITSPADDVTSSTVLQAVFAAGPHAAYWDSLLGGATFAGSLSDADPVSEKLLRYLRAYLNRLAPVMAVSPAAPPSDAVVHRWSATLPRGGAWHVWKPSFHWTEVSQRMLQPIPDDKVFIVGSGFAKGHLQMYAEGALQTVDDMLLKL